MGMGNGMTRLVAVTALVTAGLLGGCAEMAPEPKVSTIRVETSTGQALVEVASSRAAEAARERAASAEAEAAMTSSTKDDETPTKGDDERREASEEVVATIDGDEATTADEEAADTLPDPVNEEEDESQSYHLMSFRSDILSPSYPSPQGGTRDSFLPAVIVARSGHTFAVEMAVTYDTELTYRMTEGYRNEAMRLADEIRRETVRLVSSGVIGCEDLEDALSEALTLSDAPIGKGSLIKEIDVYDVCEVKPFASTDGVVTYVPVSGL